MTLKSIKAGLQAAKRRPGLVILLFAVPAVLGHLIATPIGSALSTTLSDAGYTHLDVEILADMPQAGIGALATVLGLIGLAFVLLFLWSSAAGVGLVEALRERGVRSFWKGVEDHFLSSLGLTAMVLGLALVWTVVVGLATAALFAWLSGEVAIFWGVLVLMPTLWISGLAALDLALDYARIALVDRKHSAYSSLGFGLKSGLGDRRAQVLYLCFYIPALILLLLPVPIETKLGGSFVVFLLQQLVLLVRAFWGVAWIGGEVAFYESRYEPEPLPQDAVTE